MPVEIRVPTLGESVVEATVAQWLKKPGEAVKAGEALVELETDKVNQQIEAEITGVLGEITRQEGDTVSVGEVIGVLSEDGMGASAALPSGNGAAAAAAAPVPQQAPAPAAAPPAEEAARPAATPVAQRIAAENNIDLNQIQGSGPGGKIVKDDVANRIERAASAPATATAKEREQQAAPQAAASQAATTPAPTTAAASGRSEERLPMSRRRRVIAENLVRAQHTAAMLTTFNEIDLSAVMEIRKRRKDTFKERFGVGLGFMSFFSKAVIGALKAFPYLNAEIQENEIVLKKYYDIGIAVGVEEGLVVPVVRDADRKTFAEIEKEIGELAVKARENRLTIEELRGGTFTITNGGVFGSLLSTPILNYPQVGILGMHAIQERPVVRDGEVVVRPMMYVALSYDHRIVDGGTAVRFLVRVKQLLEDPETLLLEG